MLPLSIDEISASYLTKRVTIIDDQTVSLNILGKIVENIDPDIYVQTCTTPSEALAVIRNQQPDLIITDYMMPEMNGIELTRKIRSIPGCEHTPVIMITIMNEKAILHEALENGVTDFLNKPFDHTECRARCKNLLSLSMHQHNLVNRSNYLQQQVADRIEDVYAREKETLNRLVRACAYKDCITGTHLERIGRLSRLIALEIGLDASHAELIEVASPLHDIGKIAIPDNILLKRGKLTEDEFKVMKTHTTIGYNILSDSPSPYLQTGALIALNHHEKFDGSGYPNEVAGHDIPVEARIVTVADVFDSLTNHRPYKTAWSIDDATEYLQQQQGKHLDPDCVHALISRLDVITRE